MAIQKVLYAIRIPVDLKRLLDNAARSGGVTTSQLVIKALWVYLGDKPAPRPAAAPKPAPKLEIKGNDAFKAFMANVPTIHEEAAPAAVIEAKPCKSCESSMIVVKGKWCCNDASCGLYAQQQGNAPVV